MRQEGRQDGINVMRQMSQTRCTKQANTTSESWPSWIGRLLRWRWLVGHECARQWDWATKQREESWWHAGESNKLWVSHVPQFLLSSIVVVSLFAALSHHLFLCPVALSAQKNAKLKLDFFNTWIICLQSAYTSLTSLSGFLRSYTKTDQLLAGG